MNGYNFGNKHLKVSFKTPASSPSRASFTPSPVRRAPSPVLATSYPPVTLPKRLPRTHSPARTAPHRTLSPVPMLQPHDPVDTPETLVHGVHATTNFATSTPST